MEYEVAMDMFFEQSYNRREQFEKDCAEGAKNIEQANQPDLGE
ncbi:MAG: hypothetical protein AB7V16_07115 [Vulcanibacillus sp.]